MVISSNTICALVLAGTCVFAGAADAGGGAPIAGNRGGWQSGGPPHPRGFGHHFGPPDYLIVNSAFYRAGGYYGGYDGRRSPEPLPAPVVRAAAPEPEVRIVVVRQEVAPTPPPQPVIACAAPCFTGPQIVQLGRTVGGRKARHQPPSGALVRPGSAYVIELN